MWNWHISILLLRKNIIIRLFSIETPNIELKTFVFKNPKRRIYWVKITKKRTPGYYIIWIWVKKTSFLNNFFTLKIKVIETQTKQQKEHVRWWNCGKPVISVCVCVFVCRGVEGESVVFEHWVTAAAAAAVEKLCVSPRRGRFKGFRSRATGKQAGESLLRLCFIPDRFSVFLPLFLALYLLM